MNESSSEVSKMHDNPMHRKLKKAPPPPAPQDHPDHVHVDLQVYAPSTINEPTPSSSSSSSSSSSTSSSSSSSSSLSLSSRGPTQTGTEEEQLEKYRESITSKSLIRRGDDSKVDYDSTNESDNGRKSLQDVFTTLQEDSYLENFLQTHPSVIAKHLWDLIDKPTKIKIAVATLHKHSPNGVDEEVWQQLDVEEKAKILELFETNNLVKEKAWRSNVYRFFFDFEDTILEFDEMVQALALVCALLLTIPFSIMGSLNSDFWMHLGDTLNTCPQGSRALNSLIYGGLVSPHRLYRNTFLLVTNSIACTVYSCMIGLIVSSLYYILKPPPHNRSKLSFFKMKVLIFILFSATVCAVLGVLTLTKLCISNLIVSNTDFCDRDVDFITGLGTAFVGFMFAVGVYLMY